MTQVAKAQEPSMEEILASIRRIIADDDAKPSEAVKPAEVIKSAEDARPGDIPAAGAKNGSAQILASRPVEQQVAAAPRPVPRPAPVPAPAPSTPPFASNSQDDINAMLATLDADTSGDQVRASEVSHDILELTEDMTEAAPMPIRTTGLGDDLEFSETHQQPDDPRPDHAPPVEPSSVSASLMSATTMAAVDSAFNALAHTVLNGNSRTLEDLVKDMLRPMLKSWIDDNLPGLVERIVRAEIERVSRGR